MIEVGETVDDLTLLDHNGEHKSLETPRKKVIFCFPKASTPG